MTKYVAGWNMPGYMPEMEVAEFDSFEDAKGFIQDELEVAADSSDEPEEYDAYQEGSHDLITETGQFTTSEMPDGYVYWVDIAE
jgi:hypothetical protein